MRGPISDETRAKIGAAHKGKVVSAETREKRAQAQRGKPLSPEVRAKVAASVKAMWESKSPWTAKMDARVREMWAAGDTARTIGDAIGMSKNAVIGRAHRLGLPGRRTPIIRDGRPRRSVRKPRETKIGGLDISPRITSGAIVRTLVIPEIGGRQPVSVTFQPRASSACCWPMWGKCVPPRPAPYCDAVSLPGRPYCAAHQGMSVTRVNRVVADAA